MCTCNYSYHSWCKSPKVCRNTRFPMIRHFEVLQTNQVDFKKCNGDFLRIQQEPSHGNQHGTVNRWRTKHKICDNWCCRLCITIKTTEFRCGYNNCNKYVTNTLAMLIVNGSTSSQHIPFKISNISSSLTIDLVHQMWIFYIH